MSFKTCAIVNPVAGSNRVRYLWPELQPRLRAASSSLSVRWTSGPRSATVLTQQALHDGYDRIVAIGGDGTLHEVVNGFFENGSFINPSAVLAHIACGSATDFRRTLNVPTGVESTQQLLSDRIRALDLLRVQYESRSGEETFCHAINIVAFGLSSTVAKSVTERRHFPVPPFLRYLGGALGALFVHQPLSLELTLDGEAFPMKDVHLVAVANGHTFGSGIRIAPDAVPTDGQLNVTVLHDVSIYSFLPHLPKFYRGTHTALDGVTTWQGQHFTATPRDSDLVPLDADGEMRGHLPTSIEIVPAALNVQY